jgi:hypothetical protein
MKMEHCSETSVYKIQTPGNYPEENIQHTEHGESLKSRMTVLFKLRYIMNFVQNSMFCGPGSSVGTATELRAGRSGDRMLVGRDFPSF